MMPIDSLLACPRCDAALSRSAQGITCTSCRIDFPEPDGVPWLFAEPDATMTEWHNRWQHVIAHSQRDARQLGAAAKAAKRASTRKRLQHQGEAHTTYVKQLQALLAPLALTSSANLESFVALRTRLPQQQGLTSYAANLFRDWCWGDAENAAALAAVTNAVNGERPRRVLVLGAGAGRLAYDLHQLLNPEMTVALDNNPLLIYALNRFAAGKTLRLMEFPLAPKTALDTALNRTLAAPSASAPGFIPIIADGLRAPFLPESFDLVLTPWFFDVVGAPPEDVAARINHLLTANGVWINHGSLAFSGPDPATHLCLDELTDLLAETGFADITSSEQELAYMDCPQSRHSRHEWVVTTRARKADSAEQPKRHQALPEWLVSGRQPVPLSAEFQSQVLSTRIHAFIMSLIDGKRSLRDMAAVMEEQQLMTSKEAEQAIRGFLVKMFDDAQSGRQY
jgi:SAM-dependent methyltransferase